MKNQVRFRCLGIAVLIVATSGGPALSADTPLTLNQTMDIAERRSTSIMAACATYASARGELNDTRALLWNNPGLYPTNPYGQPANYFFGICDLFFA